ncbi:hypothetical protein WME73_11220 [Sorangium sp. So ce302]
MGEVKSARVLRTGAPRRGACSSGSSDDEGLRGTAKLAAGAEDATCVTSQRGTAGAVEDGTIWETFTTWIDSTVLLRTGALAGFGVRHARLLLDQLHIVPRRRGQLHHGAGAVDRLAPLGHNSSAGFAVVISSLWSSRARPDGGITRAWMRHQDTRIRFA